MLSRALLLAFLLPAAGFTGCLGGEDPVTVQTEDNETEDYQIPETLPDGREFVAGQQFNRTENGTGGIDHKHDYWNGQESVVIYDYDVTPGATPIFERGDNSRVFVGFINLDKVPGEPERDALVYEGTGKVIFTITSAPAWADSFQFTYRTAATEWSSWAPIKPGEAFEYAPSQLETDMPHSLRSLWNWKIQATAPVPVAGKPQLFGGPVGSAERNATEAAEVPVHVKIEVLRAAGVQDWPGHPVFFEEGKPLVVAENKKGKANIQHAADVLTYGIEADQVVPDKLISMGAEYIDVWMNVTKLEMPPGVEPASFQLQWRNASSPPNSLGGNHENNETDGKTWAHWHLYVHPDGLDSPYQPESRFTFKVLVNAANRDLARCYRCVPYTLEYDLTVVAWGKPQDMQMGETPPM